MVLTEEDAWNNVRVGRDYMLEIYVDWYQSKPLIFNVLTPSQQGELGEYRNALLNFPDDLAQFLSSAGTGHEMPLDYEEFYPIQPMLFDNHPRGRMHTEETQTKITVLDYY